MRPNLYTLAATLSIAILAGCANEVPPSLQTMSPTPPADYREKIAAKFEPLYSFDRNMRDHRITKPFPASEHRVTYTHGIEAHRMATGVRGWMVCLRYNMESVINLAGSRDVYYLFDANGNIARSGMGGGCSAIPDAAFTPLTLT